MATKKTPALGRAGSKAGSGKSPSEYMASAESFTIETLEELGLSPEEAQEAEAKLERHLAQDEERVNMRWARTSLNLIRQAAELAGVPYQTYIKMAVFRQAVADIQATEAVAGKTFSLPAVGGRKAAKVGKE